MQACREETRVCVATASVVMVPLIRALSAVLEQTMCGVAAMFQIEFIGNLPAPLTLNIPLQQPILESFL